MKKIYPQAAPSGFKMRFWQLFIIVMLLLALIGYDHEVVDVILQSISDAYLQVSAFVFAALYIIYLLERLLNINALALLAKKRWEVPFASFLGALPGCGGAIIVTTQYVRGHQSFGALTAALIATMGDAAFLLIAREPLTGLTVLLLGFTVGFVFGELVNKIHGADFMRVKPNKNKPLPSADMEKNVMRPIMLDRFWLFWMIPGFVLAIAVAFQTNFSGMVGTIVLWVGVIGGVLCSLMYMLTGQDESLAAMAKGAEFSQGKQNPMPLNLKMFIDDTNFVTMWVILAFLIFELSLHFSGIDLKVAFDTFKPLVPLIAIAIGFLPGCGPQILVAALYLEGFIPLSALFGNAISNDGDALFPALALARKPALVATLYSALPACIIAYGYYFLFE